MVDVGCPCQGCPESSQFEVHFVNRPGWEPSLCQFFHPLHVLFLSLIVSLSVFPSNCTYSFRVFLPPFPFQLSL